MTRPIALPAICIKCNKSGLVDIGGRDIKPSWCTCPDIGGPYNAPPGFVARWTYEAKDAAAFREACRLASNAEREARDEMLSTFWVGYQRNGRRFVRAVPKANRKRGAAERRYANKLRALRKLQRQCEHPARSLFDSESCDVCHAHVESDIARHRHLAAEGVL